MTYLVALLSQSSGLLTGARFTPVSTSEFPVIQDAVITSATLHVRKAGTLSGHEVTYGSARTICTKNVAHTRLIDH